MADTTSLRIAWDEPLPKDVLQVLREAVVQHQLLLCGEAASGSPMENTAPFPLEEADVFYGQPEPDLLLSAPNLRWVQLSSAGYTRYDNDEIKENFRKRGVVLTNSSHVYDEPCAQHLAAMILSLARDLPWCLENQRGEHRWLDHSERSKRTRLLNGQTVLIYGFGAIARRLVEILKPLQMRLIGVRRSIRGDEGVPILTEQEADTVLGEADHVVNILPASNSTRHFFNADRFARFKPGARFYNIGRGTTVDQDALSASLIASDCLGAAYLDVTDPEPLPPEHPLWSAPNCYITPHFGGGHSEETARLVRHFLMNLRAYEKHGDFVDRVI